MRSGTQGQKTRQVGRWFSGSGLDVWPSTDNVKPAIKLPGPPELKPSQKMVNATKPAAKGPDGDVPSVDDLQKRFAQLKR